MIHFLTLLSSWVSFFSIGITWTYHDHAWSGLGCCQRRLSSLFEPIFLSLVTHFVTLYHRECKGHALFEPPMWRFLRLFGHQTTTARIWRLLKVLKAWSNVCEDYMHFRCPAQYTCECTVIKLETNTVLYMCIEPRCGYSFRKHIKPGPRLLLLLFRTSCAVMRSRSGMLTSRMPQVFFAYSKGRKCKLLGSFQCQQFFTSTWFTSISRLATLVSDSSRERALANEL